MLREVNVEKEPRQQEHKYHHETKGHWIIDEKVKHDFRGGLEKLVKNSAEENGVWQMMVAASALHQRQEHNLDELTKQNNELRLRVDGMYANPDSRVVGEKSKAEDQLDRSSVPTDDIWGEFASSIGSIH